jgi:protein-S-isoprenylcysteine O-methyltransferase Ste14
MALIEEFQQQGNWLFRWRSYLPLAFLAFIATAFVNFDWPFKSYLLHEYVEFTSLGISVIGLLIRVATVGHTPARTSGRNTKGQIAAQLNTSGMYSMLRHPLYLGNYLIGLGISLVLFVWWLPVIYSLMFWLYYERIMFAEEAFLSQQFGDEFQKWAANTPAFIPRIRNWRRPKLEFSWPNALRREYTGFMVVVIGHTGIEIAEHLVMDRRLVWEPFWVALLFGGTAIYFVLRFLKRKTTLLDVPGRR